MPPDQSKRTYLSNIIWSWAGFVALLVWGVIVMPVLIRRLGTARFGVWALATSLVDYFWLIDLGVRPAIVKLSAEFRATHRISDLNSLINTGLAYSALAASVVLLAGFLSVNAIASVLRIDDPAFGFLIRVVGVSWALGLVFNVFAAVLEGFQRFDLSNRVTILTMILRSALSLLLALAGYGLREMAVVLLISQGVGYALTYSYCRRVHPEMQLAPMFVSRRMAQTILQYARQLVFAFVGARFVQAALPTAIAYFKPIQFVTYFTQTQRLLEYAADGISRVALVTFPRAAEWNASGRLPQIVTLARSANRYCLTLWGAFAAYAFVYGGQACRLWINDEFGAQAAALFPVLVIGYTFWIGQFISASVLMSIGRYSAFAALLLAESITVVGSVALVLPRFGLVGAAAVTSVCMFLSRGLGLSVLFAAEFKLNLVIYLREIFIRPLTLIAASIVVLWICQRWWLAGQNWTELIVTALLHTILYGFVAVLWIVTPEDRRPLILKVMAFWRQRRPLDSRQPVA